jgi:hypothetical protein
MANGLTRLLFRHKRWPLQHQSTYRTVQYTQGLTELALQKWLACGYWRGKKCFRGHTIESVSNRNNAAATNYLSSVSLFPPSLTTYYYRINPFTNCANQLLPDWLASRKPPRQHQKYPTPFQSSIHTILVVALFTVYTHPITPPLFIMAPRMVVPPGKTFFEELKVTYNDIQLTPDNKIPTGSFIDATENFIKLFRAL